MLMKSGLFIFLLAVLQVSGRYKNVVPEFTDDVIEIEPEALSSSSRIESGWDAQPGQLPHHASIRTVSSAGALGHCGGSIISRRWVLTAAQCTAGRVNLIIRAGVVSLSDNNPQNIFETSDWYNFPTFDDSRPTPVQPNDITLVRLQRLVVYSRLVQPIRVQSGADSYRDYDGEQVYLSGHGSISISVPITDELRWVYLRAISNNDCAKSFASGTVLNTIICTESFNVTSQSACQGDFGGPLVYVGSNGVPTLVGLFVFTTSEDNACPPGLPTGYTRPGPYLPWFQQITGLNFENLREEDDEKDEDTTTTSTSTTTTTIPSTSTTSTTTPSTSTTSTSTPSTSTTSTSTPSTSTTTTTRPSTSTTSTTTPSASTTTTTTPSTSTTSSTTSSTSTTTTTIPSTSTTSTSTPSTSTTSTSTPSTSTTTPSTSTTSTTTPSTSTTTTITPSTSTTSSTTSSTSTTTTTTPSTSTTTTTIPSTSTSSSTTPSTSTTSTTTTTIPSTSITTTTTPSTSTTEYTPDENTTAPPEDSEEQEPDDVTTEVNTTGPPEDSEDKEDEEEDLDSSECNEDDNMAQLLKRLEVNVKVKVALSKYNMSDAVGMEVNHYKH